MSPAVTATSSARRSATARATATKAKQSKPAIDIVAAMNDRALFEPWFQGPTWAGWRVILKAAFCIPLDDGELEIFHTLAGNRPPPERQVKELWIIAGRRAGKDSVASLVGAYAGAFLPMRNGSGQARGPWS